MHENFLCNAKWELNCFSVLGFRYFFFIRIKDKQGQHNQQQQNKRQWWKVRRMSDTSHQSKDEKNYTCFEKSVWWDRVKKRVDKSEWKILRILNLLHATASFASFHLVCLYIFIPFSFSLCVRVNCLLSFCCRIKCDRILWDISARRIITIHSCRKWNKRSDSLSLFLSPAPPQSTTQSSVSPFILCLSVKPKTTGRFTHACTHRHTHTETDTVRVSANEIQCANLIAYKQFRINFGLFQFRIAFVCVADCCFRNLFGMFCWVTWSFFLLHSFMKPLLSVCYLCVILSIAPMSD